MIYSVPSTDFCVKTCISVAKYFIWSWKISRGIPGLKCHFLNILGNVSCLPLSEKSQNGFSLLVHLQQFLLGLPKIFIHEKVYHLWLFMSAVVILAKPEAIEVRTFFPFSSLRFLLFFFLI
ncbi:unnamed protein product [Larinioides sclopetarius]|uniref:Uncharacterized protein n=1 Tax=Larinioides sclopetarius TaxID=280406 RepID=A0AAV1ZK37_9ARAC